MPPGRLSAAVHRGRALPVNRCAASEVPCRRARGQSAPVQVKRTSNARSSGTSTESLSRQDQGFLNL